MGLEEGSAGTVTTIHSIFSLVRLHFYGPPVPSIGASMSPSQSDNKTNEYIRALEERE